jgi:ribosomal protein L11 methyltransferase
LTVTVWVPTADAEVAADLLWRFGPVAVEELAGGSDRSGEPTVVLRTGFGDREVADAAAGAVRARGGWRGGWRAEVSAVTDDGLDGWRSHARVEDAPPFALVPAWFEPDVAVAALDRLGGERIALRVDPGPTFGSGSHPTTRLVLSRLATLVGDGTTVLDVGCGSGVLAVGAAVLGARAVGVDVDPASGTVVPATAERNGVGDRVRFDPRPLAALAHDCRHGTPRFEVVAANLLAPVIRELADDLLAVVAAGGVLVVSGLLADRWETGVAPLTAGRRAVVDGVDEAAGWVAVTCRTPALP